METEDFPQRDMELLSGRCRHNTSVVAYLFVWQLLSVCLFISTYFAIAQCATNTLQHSQNIVAVQHFIFLSFKFFAYGIRIVVLKLE